MRKLVALLSLLAFTWPCFGQNGALEEYFFHSGKIKVVMAVALVIAIGMFIYLWRLDKKVSQLENKNDQ